MGFSIFGCIISGVMFICYCVALAYFNRVLTCRDLYQNYDYNTGYYHINTYCYSSSDRRNAAIGAGLGSFQLICAIVEFFVALASSIYCCNAVCCGAPAVGSVSCKAIILISFFPTVPPKSKFRKSVQFSLSIFVPFTHKLLRQSPCTASYKILTVLKLSILKKNCADGGVLSVSTRIMDSSL